MIEFQRVSAKYNDSSSPVLNNVSVKIEEGELVVVIGRTGAGKSTFLSAINGLFPHFSGGTLAGTVTVANRLTSTHKPREMADVVGYVGQDPLSGFVTDTVEEELAYSMEQLGVAPAIMRRRVEETLDLLGIADLRNRTLHQLSGGQQQRVAIGSVMTAHPLVLVLDEPTSALDPTGAEEVLSAITRLVHDLGVTVVLAEHRLERVVHFADRVIEIQPDGTIRNGTPREVLASASVAPPVVELGRLCGFDPLALSVRDARRQAGSLRECLENVTVNRKGLSKEPPLLSAKSIVVRHGEIVAVAGVNLELRAGEVTTLMGRNGSGKSSLLWALHGAGPRQGGTVTIAALDPKNASADVRRNLVGLVPQTPSDLLYHDSVGEELREAERELAENQRTTHGAARKLLDELAPGIPDETHPRDLSEGQRLLVVLAIALLSAPKVILLDEPTRGLDYAAKRHLSEVIGRLKAQGCAVLIATHDVEFVAGVSDRVMIMAGGEIVADDVSDAVVVGSPAFAPQIAKILSPLHYLNVDEVEKVLKESAM